MALCHSSANPVTRGLASYRWWTKIVPEKCKAGSSWSKGHGFPSGISNGLPLIPAQHSPYKIVASTLCPATAQEWLRLGFPPIQVPCLDDLFEAGLRFSTRNPWDAGWSRWVQFRWAPEGACGTACLRLEADMIGAYPAGDLHPVCPTTGHTSESWRSFAGVNRSNGHWGWQDGRLVFPHSAGLSVDY